MEKLFQLTERQAIQIAKSGVWKSWFDEEKARFQFYQDRLCMPFDVFHQAFQKIVGRSIWTHEFAASNRKHLQKEFDGKVLPPTLDEIIEMIPEEKRFLLIVSK